MKSSILNCAVLAILPTVQAWKLAKQGNGYIKYTTVTGFFLQDEAGTDPNTFDYAKSNFGLINTSYPTDSIIDPDGTKTQWQRFEFYVESLNRGCRRDKHMRHKMLFMGRHGEGWHNAAESYYGTPAWNCYWAEQTGNGTAVWEDALLTPAGEEEAYKANAFWSAKMLEGLPAPESYYTSPLSRCTTTANLTFANLDLPADRPFKPTVKEYFREDISIHTCDRRSNKTYIAEMFPTYIFESSFTEYDELWSGTLSESSLAQAARSKAVLDDIFTNDNNAWISITSHSGEIKTLLSVLGHRNFKLSTGQVIPVLVKAEYIEDEAHTTTVGPWESEATCDTPPVTSLTDLGCVCSGTGIGWTVTTTVDATTTTAESSATASKTAAYWKGSDGSTPTFCDGLCIQTLWNLNG